MIFIEALKHLLNKALEATLAEALEATYQNHPPP